MIQIHQHQGEGGLVAVVVVQPCICQLYKGAAVVQACQHVRQGKLKEMFVVLAKVPYQRAEDESCFEHEYQKNNQDSYELKLIGALDLLHNVAAILIQRQIQTNFEDF